MNIAVILLSGKGKRLGNDIPKQFLVVKNKPLYIYSVQAFYNNKKIDKILLVTNKEYVSQVKANLSTARHSHGLHLTIRVASVYEHSLLSW